MDTVQTPDSYFNFPYLHMKCRRSQSGRPESPRNEALHRRSFLGRALVGLGGISIANVLRLRAEATTDGARSTALILLWQDGGPSHFETFDPKPDAPREYRGELGTTATTLSGVHYCEILPRLARLAHRTCVIRSLHQPSSHHVTGTHNFITGYNGVGVGRAEHPDLCAVAHRVRSEQGTATLPDYVALGSGLHRGGPSYLGPVHAPFRVEGDPSQPDFYVESFKQGSRAHAFGSRLNVLAALDAFGQLDLAALDASGHMAAVDRYQRQAIELLSGSGRVARAFDLSREKLTMRERYGFHTAGQQALLARRLVEAGVGVVAVRFSPDGRGDRDRSFIGWDDHAVHGNIFEIMRRRGPQFDQAVSTLIEDLGERGLDQDVLLVVAGEFGRTPRVSNFKGCPGREHWGPAGCALLYGGGLRMGQVIGATNANGEVPSERPLRTQDVLATIYHVLGIDTKHEFHNAAGRPIPLLPYGEPIKELIA